MFVERFRQAFRLDQIEGRLEEPDAGLWEFTVDSVGASATYVDGDPGHPLDGVLLELDDDLCVVRTMDEAGQWHDSSWAEVL